MFFDVFDPFAQLAMRDDRPDWATDGRDWPHRAASRFVSAAGLRWHVQTMGAGPALLLAHGTGSATHSWRTLMPLLAERFTVVAPDLPGHGFTDAPSRERLNLPGMAGDLAALVRALGVAPEVVVGHSAGAAILARMCLDRSIDPRVLVSLNGALLAFRGMAGQVFSPIARMLAINPFASRFFAWRAADYGAVERLLRGTGSAVDREGVELYGRLMRRRGHVAAVLAMMAGWDLHAFERELPRLATPLALVVGERDEAVPASSARRVQALLPSAVTAILAGLGHLAHEEAPDRVHDAILAVARKHLTLP